VRILSYDQSLTSAAAVYFETCDDGKLVARQRYTFKPKSTGVYRLMDHRQWIENNVQCHPQLMAREQHHMRQYGNAGALQQLTALLDMRAYSSGLVKTKNSYAVIAPGTWKKFVAGKGNLAKDTNYMRVLLKSIEECALLKDVLFEIDNDDIADAICIGVTAYACRRFLGGEKDLQPKGWKDFSEKAANMFDHGKPSSS